MRAQGENAMASHTFTRQELHELVWSEPMIKLAARYGISGNGLAKACRRAAIPVPERGYWNRIQAGQKVKKTLLPEAGPNTPDHVSIDPPLPRPAAPPPPPVPQSVVEKIESEQKAAKPITVPATLSSPHRIVAAWIQQDRREIRAHHHDPFLARPHKPIDKTDLDKRRLRILSALFKVIEGRGYKLVVDDNRYRQLVEIAAGDEKLAINVHERVRQVRRYFSDEEKAKRGYLSTGQKWTQEKVPTGELVLTIGGKEWKDEQDAPLDGKLGEVLPHLAGAFEKLRLQRQREAEERDRRWKLEQERHRQEMERKRETIRFRRLLAHCETWRTAAEIRAFVAAVEATPLASSEAGEFAGWKSWALEHADRIDPLRSAEIFNRHVSDYEVYALRD
jgi:hypothetical protein